MTMAVFDGYCFVLRERALAAFFILANHGLILGNASQVPDFVDRNSGLVPLVFASFDVHNEHKDDVFRCWIVAALLHDFSFHCNSTA
jgi:hypothetical protein